MRVFRTIKRTPQTVAYCLEVELRVHGGVEDGEAVDFVHEAIRYYAHAVIWRIGKKGKYYSHVVKVRE